MNWDERVESNKAIYLQNENELLKSQLKDERKMFDFLEKAVDESKDSHSILRKFHQYKQKYFDNQQQIIRS